MALIRHLSKISRNSRVQAEAESTYNIVIQNGRKYIQINTYGSKDRVHTNMVSQTLQLDEQSAKQLFDILKAEFALT
uniref:Methionyl-tRNA formyltransferase n=2 Tax=Paenibacillus athensensis TaxID=1967502 RepID=A0A4Y8Q3M6_9BACL